MWLKISQRKGSIKDSRGRTARYQRIKDIMFEKTCANTTFMIRSVNMICLMKVVQHFSHNSKNWKKCRFLLLTKANRNKNFSTAVGKSRKTCTCSPNLKDTDIYIMVENIFQVGKQ